MGVVRSVILGSVRRGDRGGAHCAVADGGLLTGCQAQSEDPAGYGFGAGAVSLSGKFRVNTWTDEGLPVVGGTVRVPIRYELTQAPQPATAGPAKP